MEKLLQEAVSGLGLMANPTEIQAELCKLLVYEEGAFFLPHRDTEKVDGMFGTLVVSLPSKHEGGDVVATHKGESITFSSSPGSDFGFSYAAWYSDITHEVKAVTSGYRLVLTYNLIHRPSVMALENRDNTSAKLVSLLQSWAVNCHETYGPSSEWVPDGDDGCSCPTALLYMLDHQYTFAELGFTRLKGVDRGRVAEARKACEKTGFSLFLVNVEKTEEGAVECYDFRLDQNCSCDSHDMTEIFQSSLILSNIVDPEGRTAFEEDVPIINDAIFVQEDPFTFDLLEEEDFSFGDQPLTATHVYYLTVKISSLISRPGKQCFI
jgi:hypothetical protein